jgi:hypothetical protein
VENGHVVEQNRPQTVEHILFHILLG